MRVIYHLSHSLRIVSSSRLGILLVLVLLVLEYNISTAEDAFVSLAEDTPCGEIHRSTKESRILGGERADLGEFPFLASIQKNEIHICSAFIIKRQVLVSAAHCFLEILHSSGSYKDYQILVGTNNWADKTNSTNLFKASRILIHPRYSFLKPNVENDIATIVIDRPIQWSSRVQPICLAAREHDGYDEYGVVAGWGARSQSQRGNMREWMQDTNLHKVAIPIWTNKACQAEYRKHRINWNTKSSHICAGFQEKQKDTCQGDSGSPLVLQETGKRVAYGIVSMGEGCATKLPGIYTRISSFTQWIQDNSY